MSVIKKWLLAICAIILMNGCAPLRMPVIVRNAPIEMYKYAYISPTKELHQAQEVHMVGNTVSMVLQPPKVLIQVM